MPAAKKHYPDALVPVRSPYSGSLPDRDNRIPHQTAQPFWLDIWIPADARPGEYGATARLNGGATRETMPPIVVNVLPAVIPADDPVAIDHNSYGTAWFAEQYPRLAGGTTAFYGSAAFYDLCIPTTGCFTTTGACFISSGTATRARWGRNMTRRRSKGAGRRSIADWTAYDRHYGPLLDGSAFAGSRRGPRPIPFVYLPINPEWPASFLWWGEPGYQREFTNVVSEMERHFREKGWTSTRFELFSITRKGTRDFRGMATRRASRRTIHI